MPAGTGNAGQSAHQPAIAVCVACTAGVVSDRLLAPGWIVWLACAVGSLVFWIYAFRRHGGPTGSATILLALLAASGVWHHTRWRLFQESDLGFYEADTPQPICVEGWTYTAPRHQMPPPPDPLSTIFAGEESRVLVQIERVRDGREWRIASGRVSLTVKGQLTNVRCGDRIRILGLLSKPPVPLNPGERSVVDFERAERRLCRLHAQTARCVQILERGVYWRPSFFMNWLRERFDRYLRQYVSNPRAGLSCAILLGTREDVDRERNEDFMTTGTVHLLAISGLNVGILAYGFWIAGRMGLMSRALTLVGGIVFVAWYALLTDAQPPVVRAAVLVTVMCVAKLCGRQSLNFNTLAVAGVVVLVLNPASLFLVGTQLSFLAVATMACVPALIRTDDYLDDPLQRLIAETRPWPERLFRKVVVGIWQSFALSTVIWLISLPLVTYRFNVVSPVGTVLNPIVCLPMAIALFAGFGVMVFGWFAPPLAAVCGWICDGSLWVMEYSIDQGLKIPGNHFWGPAPPGWWVAVFYTGVALTRCSARFRPPRRWCWAIMAIWFGIGTWLTFGPTARSDTSSADKLVCTFISVGHGTSALVEFPGGQTLLYDAGKLGFSHSGGRTVSAVLWSRRINHLDAIVISHADADHFNAIPYLLDRFSVGVVYVSPTMFQGSQPAVDALRESFIRHRIEVRKLSHGDRLQSGRGCDIRILHPPDTGISGSDNANSLVLLVDFAGQRLLLPGDMESPGTERLFATPPLDCDVLMAPHHGSIRSNPAGFSDWSAPEIVVVSGTAKRDPSPVLQAYKSAGAQVFHTAFDGAVQVTMEAEGVSVNTFRNGRPK